MHENDLYEAIMEAVKMAALQNTSLLDQIKRHISMGLSEDEGNDRCSKFKSGLQK